MKTQIIRLSPHQNGKVAGIILALLSLFAAVPLFLGLLFSEPSVATDMDRHRPPAFLPLLFPVGYFISGYLITVIYCALYNAMFRFIGGFEFEARSQDA